MKDLMLDIETLGTSYNAVITQMGACYFDRQGGIGDKFLVNIQIQDCLNQGLVVDAGAIKFWLEQKERSFLIEPLKLSRALGLFRNFCKDVKFIWCHSTFDLPIVANAYKIFGEKLPFSYRAIRDIRTLVDLSNHQKPKTVNNTHNALEDCIYQVGYCSECFIKLAKK